VEDPALNRNLEECKELHTRWSQFHDFFNLAVKGEKITPQAEMKFLELKTRIAMLHDGFMESLSHDHKTGQNVLSILASCILLRRIPMLSNAEIQKLDYDWNEVYMLMTETIATLEEEKERLLGINETAYKMGKMRDRTVASISNFFTSPLFKFAAVLGIFGFVVFGIPAFDIYDYRELPTDLPWTASTVYKVEGLIRKVNKEYPLRVLSEHDRPSDYHERSNYVSDGQRAMAVTVDYFKTQYSAMGFLSADSDSIDFLVDNRIDFQGDSVSLAFGSSITDRMTVYILLLKDTEAAEEFIRLRNKGLATLPDGGAAKRREFNLCRARNLIGVFHSTERELREDYPRQHWAFTEEQVNL
jgi:hypothetical protein